MFVYGFLCREGYDIMNYQECITYLEQVCPRGSSGGKERTAIMAELMGNPQDTLRIIHVAGTNGKGSTSAVIESILRHGGYRVGLFTSPHLERYEERIQINRQPIPEAEFTSIMTHLIEDVIPQAMANGMSHPGAFGLLTLAAFQYFAGKTDFVVLKRDVGTLTDEHDVDLERYYFAPTDYLPDEDDELTKSDKLMLLVFMCQNPNIDAKTMRGIYWCFVEERQGRNRDKSIKQLHEMSKEEKEKLVESVVHQVHFENRLHEDDEYVETIKEFVKIESGGGKLQDRKKVIPLAKKLCEIMDRNADDFMTTEEYAKGEPDFKKARPKEENIRENISESREALNNAFSYYNSFRAYRNNHPLTSEDERMIEVFFKQRFDEDMF